MAAAQPEANSSMVSTVMINPCSRWLWGLEWGLGGCRAYRSTNLLLRDIIELYPDLLLGRRRVMMRSEDGRW